MTPDPDLTSEELDECCEFFRSVAELASLSLNQPYCQLMDLLLHYCHLCGLNDDQAQEHMAHLSTRLNRKLADAMRLGDRVH
jgi:hypothetical protein